MAETSSCASTVDLDLESNKAAGSSSFNREDNQELKNIRNLLWGPNIRTDIFQRWSQGINDVFSLLLCGFTTHKQKVNIFMLYRI